MDEWLFGPDDLRVNVFTRRVEVGGRPLSLSRISFDILVALLRNRRGVVTIDELVRGVWGFEDSDDPRFAHAAVYRLRKQLGEAGAPDVIESVRGVGFRIAGETVSDESTPRSAAEIALDGASTAILLVSNERKILWANRAAAELSGYSLDELYALPSTAALAPPERRPFADDNWEAVSSGQRRTGLTFDLTRKDGTRIKAGASWKPLVADDADAGYSVLEVWPIEDRMDGSVSRAG